jgi:hypothetical protein
MKIGRIYRIKDLTNGNCYYGSTTKTVEQRFRRHKHLYKYYLNEDYNYVSVFDIIKNDNCICEELEEIEFDDIKELRKRETWYIENNPCINKRRATTDRVISDDEREWKKQYNHDYYEKNKYTRNIHKHNL